MIGRADIKGSKSSVAMNSCAAIQASWIVGNSGRDNDSINYDIINFYMQGKQPVKYQHLGIALFI